MTRSKLSKPLAWIRKRRNAITLPQDILINILHYFPRKQLVNQFCLVNSTFLHVSNRLLPNLHVINNVQIKFLGSVECLYPPEKMKIQTFHGVELCIDQQNPIPKSSSERTIEDFLTALPFCGYKCNSRHRSNKQQRLIISADDLLRNLPPWYVRFSTFDIRERLSPFEQKGTNGGERFAWRLWPRSVMQDDLIWLSALSDGGYTINGWQSPTPGGLIPAGFEKEFYDFNYLTSGDPY